MKRPLPANRMAGKAAKRLLDLLVTSICLLIIWPLLLVIAAAVRGCLGSPVIFRQVRPGRFGRPFVIYKFRTMNDRCDAIGHLLPDAERLTAFGRFLRSSSLDELPELFNVLKGEMSLVGPRPLLMEYLPRYDAEQARRHEVLPGITGWAQINGRNGITWEEKFQHDVWYVDHQSFTLDVKILFTTVIKVAKKEGISAAGCATMPYFLGSEKREDGRLEPIHR